MSREIILSNIYSVISSLNGTVHPEYVTYYSSLTEDELKDSFDVLMNEGRGGLPLTLAEQHAAGLI